MNTWHDRTLCGPLDDKEPVVMILIMPRPHEDDPLGHVLAQEP